jgi:tRNA pseudouridine38-40 synthase
MLTAIVRLAGRPDPAGAGHNTRMDRLPRIALEVAYLGGTFAGWQRQPDARTVQGELERALAGLYRRPVRAVGAGRTDAGVHAAAQVAHFEAPFAVPTAGIVRALNGTLSPEVRILRAWPVPPWFDARASATGKRYRYRLAWMRTLPPWEAQRRLAVPFPLDPAAVAAASASVLGEHDFAAFALAGHAGHGRRGTVRTMTGLRVRGRGRRLDIVIEGDGFLRGMVRRIAGALIEVGRGAQPPGWFAALVADPATRPPAPTAPPHGLTLERVTYPPPRPPVES